MKREYIDTTAADLGTDALDALATIAWGFLLLGLVFVGAVGLVLNKIGRLGRKEDHA